MSSLDAFTQDWTTDGLKIKPMFLSFYETVSNMENVAVSYVGRPGISHSLRAAHSDQKRRPLFVMIDVIDDEPGQRWLSVCFYGDMITDPEALGDLIPEGLLGDDGYCFDISGPDEDLHEYVRQRIHEAYAAAANDK